MTNKQHTLIFNLVNNTTASLIAKYPDDENLINDWYGDLLIDIDEDTKAYNVYLSKLIAMLEIKEDYERCGVLLKIKKKIK